MINQYAYGTHLQKNMLNIGIVFFSYSSLFFLNLLLTVKSLSTAPAPVSTLCINSDDSIIAACCDSDIYIWYEFCLIHK